LKPVFFAGCIVPDDVVHHDDFGAFAVVYCNFYEAGVFFWKELVEDVANIFGWLAGYIELR
jgi:hypothetical protein